MKTREVPSELREFLKVFDKLAYVHEASTVWTDFLDCFIKGFSFDDATEFNESLIRRYDKEERLIFGSLVYEMIRVYDKMMDSDSKAWADPLGIFYEVMASNFKRSGFGQFFTPETVVDFMTEITMSDHKGFTINDPACGSGRLLLAAGVRNPGLFCIGEDIDQVCCKMTVVNMLMHGLQGEVIHHDSIRMNFYKGWRLTRHKSGCPMTYKIKESESILMTKAIMQKVEEEEKKVSETQLQLFE